MKELLVLFDATNPTQADVADYLLRFARADGRTVRTAGLDETGMTSLAGVLSGDRAVVSLTIRYVPQAHEQVTYWILDPVTPAPSLMDAPVVAAKVAFARFSAWRRLHGKRAFAASDEIKRSIVATFGRVETLHLPALRVSESVPGPYSEYAAIECGDVATTLLLLDALLDHEISTIPEVRIFGVPREQAEELEGHVAGTTLQFEWVADETTWKETVRCCRVYVPVALAPRDVEAALIAAAAFNRPIVAVAMAESTGLLIDGVTGFVEGDDLRMAASLIDGFFAGTFDASEYGDNAFSVLMEKRRPEKTLLEALR